MHRPFLALDRARSCRHASAIDFLHQDPANDIRRCRRFRDRLRNSFPFFGNDWMRTGGIGEFTGGGVAGLRAIAANGWRGEDHTLNLTSFSQLVIDREIVNAEIPLNGLRWVISHVPQVTEDLVNRFKAMGGGCWSAGVRRARARPALPRSGRSTARSSTTASRSATTPTAATSRSSTRGSTSTR